MTVRTIVGLQTPNDDARARFVARVIKASHTGAGIVGIPAVAVVSYRPAFRSVDLNGRVIEDVFAKRGDIPLKGGGRQSGTLGKRVAADRSDACRNDYVGQCGALVKGILADGCEVCRQDDFRKLRAVLKRAIADHGDRIGEHELGDVGAGKAGNSSHPCLVAADLTHLLKVLFVDICRNDQLHLRIRIEDRLVEDAVIVVSLALFKHRCLNVSVGFQISVVEGKILLVAVFSFLKVLCRQAGRLQELAVRKTADGHVAVDVNGGFVRGVVDLHQTEVTDRRLLFERDACVLAVLLKRHAALGTVNHHVVVVGKKGVERFARDLLNVNVLHEVNVRKRGRIRKSVFLNNFDLSCNDLAGQRGVVGKGISHNRLDRVVDGVTQGCVGRKIGVEHVKHTFTIRLEDRMLVVRQTIFSVCGDRDVGQRKAVCKGADADRIDRFGNGDAREFDAILKGKIADLFKVIGSAVLDGFKSAATLKGFFAHFR